MNIRIAGTGDVDACVRVLAELPDYFTPDTHETLVTEMQSGRTWVEAKTLDASSDYEPYVATRAFWESQGFVQIDMIDLLPGWQPGNPSAIYVAALDATR